MSAMPRLAAFIILAQVLFPHALAGEKVVYNIKPGSATMSPEERAIEADPAGGIQHGVILAEETRRDDTNFMGTEEAYHFRAKILSGEARTLADISIPFDPESEKLMEWWGRTILPEGRVIELDRSEVKLQSVVDFRGWDISVLKAAMPGVEPGCVIDYGYRIQHDRVPPWERIPLQREWPVRWFHYQWLPAEWFPSQYFVRRRPGIEIEVKRLEGSVLMQARDLPRFIEEPYMPPDDTVRASALLLYRAPRSSADPDLFWDDIAKKEESRLSVFIGKDKVLTKTLKTMRIPAGSSLVEKLEIAYRWIEANVESRQLRTAEETAEVEGASSDGRGTAGPGEFSAEDILARGEGSPAEILDLYLGIARRLGAEAHIVLAPDRRANLWDKAMLSASQLDSRIVSVREPGAGDEKAILVAPASGLPFGAIPWWVTPTTALRATAEGAREIRLPHSEARMNVMESGVRVSFSGESGALARWWARGAGQRGHDERLSLRRQEPLERRERLEELCGKSGDLEVKTAQAPALTEVIADFRLECEGTLVNVFVDEYEDELLIPFNGPWIVPVPELTAAERAHPVVFTYPFIDLATVEIDAPEGFEAAGELPGTKLETPFGNYGLRIERTPSGYKVERAFALLALTVDIAEYGELRGFLEKVRVADSKRLEFARSGDGM